MNEKRWWTKREMQRMVLATALLWLGFVAAISDPLHNGNVALLFFLALVGSKTYIFGQMFLWMRDDRRELDDLYASFGFEDQP